MYVSIITRKTQENEAFILSNILFFEMRPFKHFKNFSVLGCIVDCTLLIVSYVVTNRNVKWVSMKLDKYDSPFDSQCKCVNMFHVNKYSPKWQAWMASSQSHLYRHLVIYIAYMHTHTLLHTYVHTHICLCSLVVTNFIFSRGDVGVV